MAYWLMKSEPNVFSIEDLRRSRVAGWEGVRNYQARKFLRAMRRGDLAFFYHSSARPPAIVGLMEITREAYPDTTAEGSCWDQVDVRYKKTFARPLSLDQIKQLPALSEMVLLKNSRLSVQPVTANQWKTLKELLSS